MKCFLLAVLLHWFLYFGMFKAIAVCLKRRKNYKNNTAENNMHIDIIPGIY